MPTPTPDPHETRPPENPLEDLAVHQAERRFKRGGRTRPGSPALIFQRAARIYEKHQRRARQAGALPDYGPDDLRRFIQRRLAAGSCPYCRRSLTATSFAVTHKNPPRRGGRHALANLVVCCKGCRAVKGPLDEQEYRELLLLMRGWPDVIRRLFVARFRRARRPRPPDTPGG